MASKSTLNPENLEALGAARLAALLMEVSTGDAAIKRRLRLELADAESPRKLAGDIRKRLSAIEGGKSYIGWRSAKGFRAELKGLAGLIAGNLAKASPGEALDLAWQFIGMADGILERLTDTAGDVIEIFHSVTSSLPGIAGAAAPGTPDLAATTARAVLANGYGQSDGLIMGLAPVLGPAGLDQVRGLLVAASRDVEPRQVIKARQTSRWRRRRRMERDVTPRRPKRDIIHQAFLEIADALGDVDAYIALHPAPIDPAAAVRIAERLLTAGRAEEALAVLDASKASAKAALSADWYGARIAALERLGRAEDAQQERLSGFQQTLGAPLLRDYLKRLPDFDDLEAEDAAVDFARTFPSAAQALDFLLRWPNLEAASSLILARHSDIEARDEDLLLLGVDKLSSRYPLAAVLLLRKLISRILMLNLEQDFGRAADYLADCARLDAHIDTYQGFDGHDAYVARLRANFKHRQDFWDAVS